MITYPNQLSRQDNAWLRTTTTETAHYPLTPVSGYKSTAPEKTLFA